MKNRLHDKKAGIAILISLIIISVAEIIFRAVVVSEIALTTSNLGEQLVVIILALAILIMTIKGKDRLCYICYGAWIGYFVLDQMFELPSVIFDCVEIASKGFNIVLLSPALHAVSAICIIAISIILVEYMNDGSIYNRAFNFFCAVAILTTLGSIFVNVYNIVNGMPLEILLAIFNNISRLAMIFLFTFFAYDSAKKQLNKVDFSK